MSLAAVGASRDGSWNASSAANAHAHTNARQSSPSCHALPSAQGFVHSIGHRPAHARAPSQLATDASTMPRKRGHLSIFSKRNAVHPPRDPTRFPEDVEAGAHLDFDHIRWQDNQEESHVLPDDLHISDLESTMNGFKIDDVPVCTLCVFVCLKSVHSWQARLCLTSVLFVVYC